MKVYFYILLLIFIVSCKGKTNFDKPDDLIPKDEMIDILTDLHLAAGATNVNNLKGKKSNKYTDLVYNKYRVDSARFASSNLYYTSRNEEYKKMFIKVEERLQKMRDQHTTGLDSLAKMVGDSLKIKGLSKPNRRPHKRGRE